MNKETKKTIELLNAARKNLLDTMYADTIEGEQILSLEQFNKIADIDDVLANIAYNLGERGRK